MTIKGIPQSYSTFSSEIKENELKSPTSVDSIPVSLLTKSRGIILAFLSGLFMSPSSLLVKKTHMFSGELSLFSFLLIGVFALPVAINSGSEFFHSKKIFSLVVIRGVSTAFCLFFRFETFQRLSMAEANVIVFSSPAMVAILGRIFLKERCRIALVVSVVLTSVGLILIINIQSLVIDISKEELYMNRILGILFGLGSALTNAFTYLFLRAMGKHLHWSVVLSHYIWTTSTVNALITIASGQFSFPNQQYHESWMILALGATLFLGQTFLTKAMQVEHAGPVSIVRTGTDIVAVFVWQILFLSEVPTIFSVSGAVLVILGCGVFNLSQWVLSLPDTSSAKTYLNYLTY